MAVEHLKMLMNKIWQIVGFPCRGSLDILPSWRPHASLTERKIEFFSGRLAVRMDDMANGLDHATHPRVVDDPDSASIRVEV